MKKDDTVTIRRKVERALANLEETALALREKMFVACSNLPDLEPEFDAFDRAFSRLVDARKPPTLEERAVEVCRKMLRREHAEDSINTRWLTEAIYKEVAAIVKEANRADK